MAIKFFRATLCGLVVALLLGACVRAPTTPPPISNATRASVPVPAAPPEPGYFGWTLAANDGALSVVGLIAGPAAQAGVHVGDRVADVDALGLGVDVLRARLEAVKAGGRLRLTLARDGHPVELEVTPGRAEDWRGPAALPATSWVAEEATPAPWMNEVLGALPASTAPGVARLRAALDRLARDGAARNTLARVRAALQSPAAGAASAGILLDALNETPAAPTHLPAVLCRELAAACPPTPSPPAALTLDAAAAALTASATLVENALAALGRTRAEALADLRVLAVETAAGRLIYAQPDAVRAIRAMQDSTRIDYGALLAAWSGLIAVATAPLDSRSAAPSGALPPALAGHVDGEVLGWRDTPAGPLVLGGPGPNRYDMDALAGVIDVGGDDVYRWGEGDPRSVQLIVDEGGDDRYEAAFSGAAAAWLGVVVVIDEAGDDRYRAVFGGCGAGLHGFALLDDRGGNDRYQCDAWGEGAALYGGGVLLDGGGDDRYLAQTLAQGVGGPRGMGVLVDANGNDLYRANGLVESSYRTPAVFLGMSQGVGYGLRPHDHGGLGVLLDGAGDDRYEGGEFSQGGGYFWGMGVLEDRGGNDLYYGNRYAQGFAAHAAVGMLFDRAGDDRYWSMTAAAQGAAWDQSVALFFDGGGDDDHRAGDLSQGTGAQHALAVLYDAAGDDVYWSSGANAQGAAGPNGYALDPAVEADTDAPVPSLGVLYDAAGRDRYSTGLKDGASRLRAVADTRQDDAPSAVADRSMGYALDGGGCAERPTRGTVSERSPGTAGRDAANDDCAQGARRP